jgi:hypothetical protein
MLVCDLVLVQHLRHVGYSHFRYAPHGVNHDLRQFLRIGGFPTRRQQMQPDVIFEHLLLSSC